MTEPEPKLAPCPFCGGDDCYVIGIGQQGVRCMTCRAEGPPVLQLDPDLRDVTGNHFELDRAMRALAVARWNRAARIPADADRLACIQCGATLYASGRCACSREALASA